MAERADKPPILRVLILLVALVGGALMLAALSPAAPEHPPSGAPADPSVTAPQAPGTRP